jgi:nitroimidazol reductase NimA-like FMN-containing flavoprotein (pyridoxamine 5'-phosphate oxidase superfamily)
MPLGELRRKDREMSLAESEECLARALVGRIGTVGPEGMPYVLPMNFCYDPASRTIFLHHGTRGHILDNLAHNPSSCFEIDEPGPIIATGPRSCNTGQLYRSVICFGKARVISDQKEKEKILSLFVKKYIQELTPDRKYDPGFESVDGAAVIALKVEVMTGKKRQIK